MNNYATDRDTMNAPFFMSLALAQLSSWIATIVSYPFDTTSRQKMLWSGRGSRSFVTVRHVVSKKFWNNFNWNLKGSFTEYDYSILRQITTIIEKDGPIGFYRGLTANLMSTLCGSLLLVTYDIVKLRFDQLMESKVFRL